ncbi:MAG: hypothetical protein RIE73_20285, partial [Coleofasciculus sp. C1-SOL-03]
TFEIFVILKNEGLAGLWQFIQDKIGDLKVMVIDTIQNFVIESVIKQGVLWVISLLNPASAFAKACKMIYDIIMFFIERGSQIVELVNAVMESVTAIANGALGGAAKLIENALSKALPVVISFMASLLGLGGISKKIQEIIQKVKEPIDKAIDWLIAQAVKFAKKIGKKLGFGKGKGKSKKEGEKQGENKGEQLEDSEVGKTVNFSGGDESHRLWIKTQGTSTTVMVASTPTSVEAKLNEWQGKLDSLPDDKRPQAQSLLGTARQHLGTTEQKAQKTAKEMEEAKQNSADEKAINEAEQADNQTEAAEETLADVLQKLFDLFGEGNTLVEWWKVSEQFNTKDGKTHKLFFLGEGEAATLMVASNPESIEKWVSRRKHAEPKPTSEENSALDKALAKKEEIDELTKDREDTNKIEIKALLETKLQELAELIKKGGVDTEELPLTQVTYTMRNGKSSKVVAQPLTKWPGNTSGERSAGGSTGPNPKGWELGTKINMQNKNSWERVHLLTAEAHGPFTNWNVIPARKNVNTLLRDNVENKIKELKNKNKEMYFEMVVQYHSSTQENELFSILKDTDSIPKNESVLDSDFPAALTVNLKNETDNQEVIKSSFKGGFDFSLPAKNEIDIDFIKQKYRERISNLKKDGQAANRTDLYGKINRETLKKALGENETNELLDEIYGEKAPSTKDMVMTLLRREGGNISYEALVLELTNKKIAEKTVQNAINSLKKENQLEVREPYSYDSAKLETAMKEVERKENSGETLSEKDKLAKLLWRELASQGRITFEFPRDIDKVRSQYSLTAKTSTIQRKHFSDLGVRQNKTVVLKSES